MNAKPIHVYECQICRKVYRDRIFAERCCESSHCEYCGIPTAPGWTACRSCAELAKASHATHVSLKEYMGKMICAGDDKYMPTEDVEDAIDNEEIPVPYVWGCDEFPLRLDIESILENELQDHHEDAEFDHEGELIEFVEAWNAKQTDASYFPNNTVVVLDEARFSAMLLQFEFRAAMLA